MYEFIFEFVILFRNIYTSFDVDVFLIFRINAHTNSRINLYADLYVDLYADL